LVKLSRANSLIGCVVLCDDNNTIIIIIIIIIIMCILQGRQFLASLRFYLLTTCLVPFLLPVPLQLEQVCSVNVVTGLDFGGILMLVGAWWCLVPGAWCLVPGAWCLVPGAWCLVPGAWCLVPLQPRRRK
jgi:hypothetical protein